MWLSTRRKVLVLIMCILGMIVEKLSSLISLVAEVVVVATTVVVLPLL